MLAGEQEQLAAYRAWPPLISLLASDRPLLQKRRTVRETLISPILHTLQAGDGTAAVRQASAQRTSSLSLGWQHAAWRVSLET